MILPLRIILAVLLICPAAAAQVRDTLPPPPADTIVPDTVRLPPKRLVPLGRSDTTAWSLGVWHFDRDALRAESATSLYDLLVRIPGIVALRAGLLLQPEAASAFGGTAGRIEILRDGVPIDPLDASVPDLSRIPLIELDEVVVERRLDLLRIRVRSAEAEDPRPYSRVEAGIGRPDVNLFRGIFLAPRVLGGPLGFAIERPDTDGEGRREPADAFAAWLKWGLLSDHRGVQVELGTATINRDVESPWPAQHRRTDVVMRARNEFLPGFVGELWGGTSSMRETSLEARSPTDTLPVPRYSRSLRRVGVRAAWERDFLALDGAVVHRSGDFQARWQGSAGAAIDVREQGRLRGEAIVTRWRDGSSAVAANARADFAPLPYVRLFAELGAGDRLAPRYPGGFAKSVDEADDSTAAGGPAAAAAGTVVRSDVRSFRVGGEVRFRGLRVGAALVDRRADSIPTFGLPFDSAWVGYAGGHVRGWEATARYSLFGDRLAADFAHVNWLSGTRWPYLPAQTWRAGLTLGWLPLPSGNLEIHGRLEALHRGSLALPAPGAGAEPPWVEAAARTVVNGHLQIRIVDVRIFARYEDWQGQELFDVPDRGVRGPRVFYGVKWFFFN